VYPNAWRAALRVVEQQLGNPAEQPKLGQTIDARARTP
jgi:hypothetical protein